MESNKAEPEYTGRPRASDLRKVLESIKLYGLLLEADPKWPSVSSLVAGEPVRGSWWGHPRGRAIFIVTRWLADHSEIIVARIISGKITYVHRKLWPALLTVAASAEPWQRHRLSATAETIFSQVKSEGMLRTDQLYGSKSKALGEAVRELERRLLVHSQEVHTERGAHAKYLESWDHWARRVKFKYRKMPVERAKVQFEQIRDVLNLRFRADHRLPWPDARGFT